MGLGKMGHLALEAIPLPKEGGHLTPKVTDLNQAVLSIGKVSVI